MSGTFAVVRTDDDGRAHTTAGFATREDAERHDADVAGALGIEPGEVVDLLPELEQRFPVGTQVWLRQLVYWRRGQHGEVTAGHLDSIAEWPERGPSPWYVSTGGASVHVRLDDGCESWWPAAWLDTR